MVNTKANKINETRNKYVYFFFHLICQFFGSINKICQAIFEGRNGLCIY